MTRRYIIGMDEAGYGPKLGPLVIATTVFSVPATCDSFEFWSELNPVLTYSPKRNEDRLHVADSKRVYSSARGICSLERSVLGFALLGGYQVSSLRQLIKQFARSIPESFQNQPWYHDRDLSLPLASQAGQLSEDAENLHRAFQACSLKLEEIAVEVICPEEFNDLVETLGNKSELLTRCSLGLINRVCPLEKSQVLILADKHGGRNRYKDHLHEAFPDQFFLQEVESRNLSRYRARNRVISFEAKSEKHFPVALASMTAKYVREICMELFNKYWQEKLPALRPTKGYPQDAVRFRSQIEPLLPQLDLSEKVLWRNR